MPIAAFLAHRTSRFAPYYFYVRDPVLGPIIMRVASFFPFHAAYWLNGHSFIERELNRKRIGFRKKRQRFSSGGLGPSSWGRSSQTRNPAK